MAPEYFSKETRLKVYVRALNDNGEIAEDEKKLAWLLPVLIAVTVVMLWLSRRGVGTVLELNEDKDWVRTGLQAGLILSLLGLVMKWLGHLDLGSDGFENTAWDYLYLVAHSTSESIIIGLLLLMGFGWTTTYLHMRDFDLYIPLLAVLGLVNVLLTLLNKITDTEHNKYHMYDTIPSYILLFFRSVSALIFAVGLILTYLSSGKAQASFRKFLVLFGSAGMLYFCTLPGVMAFAHLVDEGSRSSTVFILVELTKNATNAVLTWLIANNRSFYRKVSLANKSFISEDAKNF